MCLHIAEYDVRSAVETTSAMVKLAFKLTLVCETREMSKCLSPTNKMQTRRVHTHWRLRCERTVSEVSARRVKSLP